MRRILSITAATAMIGVAALDIVAVAVASRPKPFIELHTEHRDLIVADNK